MVFLSLLPGSRPSHNGEPDKPSKTPQKSGIIFSALVLISPNKECNDNRNTVILSVLLLYSASSADVAFISRPTYMLVVQKVKPSKKRRPQLPSLIPKLVLVLWSTHILHHRGGMVSRKRNNGSFQELNSRLRSNESLCYTYVWEAYVPWYGSTLHHILPFTFYFALHL